MAATTARHSGIASNENSATAEPLSSLRLSARARDRLSARTWKPCSRLAQILFAELAQR